MELMVCVILMFEMRKQNRVHREIYEAIRFIEQKQLEMEEVRLDLNHEIMFNLRDTYISIANHQTAITSRHLADFLGVHEGNASLYKFVQWNNHCSSLNLTFAQFSAVIITKEDRLLAKMVLERQEMGAIPNFLLDKVRTILLKELEIHEYCLKCQVSEEEVKEWIQTVIDENGDVCQFELQQFLENQQRRERSSRSSRVSGSSLQESIFIRFLQSSGNITGERILFLWKGCNHYSGAQDISSKMHKLSTNITSPKSLIGSQSYQSLRPEFFDCLSRPVATVSTQIRESKSIEKHIGRINSLKNLKIISMHHRNSVKKENLAASLVQMLRQIIEIERQTENSRIELRLCPDFYPILFYESIPKDRNKNVTPTNLRDYLESFGYYVQISEIYYLFRRYSNGNKLGFNSFCSMFDPIDKEFNLLQKNRFIQSLQDVNYSTKKCYFSLILLIISQELKINQIKLNYLKKCKNLSQIVNHLFSTFGSEEQLSEQEVRNAFKYYSKSPLPLLDLRMITRRLDQNKGSEGTLEKDNLMRELIPYICKPKVK